MKRGRAKNGRPADVVVVVADIGTGVKLGLPIDTGSSPAVLILAFGLTPASSRSARLDVLCTRRINSDEWRPFTHLNSSDSVRLLTRHCFPIFQERVEILLAKFFCCRHACEAGFPIQLGP